MSNIMRFLVGNFVHISEKSRKVVVSHVLEGEFPKLFIFVRVKFSVIPRVLVSSAVSQPNIVAFIRKHESRRLVLVINDPSIRTVD